MSNLVETLRDIRLTTEVDCVPAHMFGQRLAVIQRICDDVLRELKDNPPVENVDLWGDEDPTQGFRR